MLINPLMKTLKAASYSRLWVLVIQCVFVCAVLLGIVVFAIGTLLLNTSIVNSSWLDGVVDAIGIIGSGVVACFLFPVLLPVTILLFYEKVASIIEAKEYQECKTLKPENIVKATWCELKFALWALFLNIICLPLYFVPLINIAVYYLLNSYLLGKEVFNIISVRYVERGVGVALWKSYRLKILSAGFLITVFSNVPFLNLVTPLFAIILMVHVIQSLVRKNKTS